LQKNFNDAAQGFVFLSDIDEYFRCGIYLNVFWRIEMDKGTLTRAQLSEAVYQQIGLSRSESAHLVEQVLEEVSRAVENGHNVKISSFGTFVVRSKGGRVGRNPKTGQEVPIDPRRVLTFRPSQILRDRVNSARKSKPKA
jgi:integration host factor subunit alpha